MQIKFFILVRRDTFFGTRREYCASEEGKRMLGTAFREEEEK